MHDIEQSSGAMFAVSLAAFVMSLVFSKRRKRKPGRTSQLFMYVSFLFQLVEALTSFRAAIESTAAFERRQTRFERWMTREGAT